MITAFTRSLSVYGITLIAGDDVPDDFLESVADVVVEMFPTDATMDTAQQEVLLGNLHAYRAVIPVFVGEPEFDGSESELDALFDHNSVQPQPFSCDKY